RRRSACSSHHRLRSPRPPGAQCRQAAWRRAETDRSQPYTGVQYCRERPPTGRRERPPPTGQGLTMRVRVLGAIEIVDTDTGPAPVRPAKVRRLLCALVVRANAVASFDWLADAV